MEKQIKVLQNGLQRKQDRVAKLEDVILQAQLEQRKLGEEIATVQADLEVLKRRRLAELDIAPQQEPQAPQYMAQIQQQQATIAQLAQQLQQLQDQMQHQALQAQMQQQGADAALAQLSHLQQAAHAAGANPHLAAQVAPPVQVTVAAPVAPSQPMQQPPEGFAPAPSTPIPSNALALTSGGLLPSESSSQGLLVESSQVERDQAYQELRASQSPTGRRSRTSSPRRRAQEEPLPFDSEEAQQLARREIVEPLFRLGEKSES